MAPSMFEPVYKEIFPFWNEISPETRDTICQNSVAMTYLKGTTIHDGTECSGVFFIRSGCLRVYLLSEKGKDITLYRLYAGDMCMLSASCVLRGIQFDVLGEAERDTVALFLPAQVYQGLMEESAAVANFTNELMADRFSEVMRRMDQLLSKKLDVRLAALLGERAGDILAAANGVEGLDVAVRFQDAVAVYGLGALLLALAVLLAAATVLRCKPRDILSQME